jgi:hypothetical protein
LHPTQARDRISRLGSRPPVQHPHSREQLGRIVATAQQRHERERPRLAGVEGDAGVDLPQPHHIEAPLVGQAVAEKQPEGVLSAGVRARYEVQDRREDGRVAMEDQPRVVLGAP